VAEGRRTLELVRAGQRLQAAAGVNTDAELAIFEADYGDPARAVKLARAAWGNAPSVRSADALGWALTRAGRAREGLRYARRALRLGSRDASFLYHAGMSARAAGRKAEAQPFLRDALAADPGFSPVHARTARRVLDRL
jgi:tetratricopeptide (TPR) repeat protein